MRCVHPWIPTGDSLCGRFSHVDSKSNHISATASAKTEMFLGLLPGRVCFFRKSRQFAQNNPLVLKESLKTVSQNLEMLSTHSILFCYTFAPSNRAWRILSDLKACHTCNQLPDKLFCYNASYLVAPTSLHSLTSLKSGSQPLFLKLAQAGTCSKTPVLGIVGVISTRSITTHAAVSHGTVPPSPHHIWQQAVKDISECFIKISNNGQLHTSRKNYKQDKSPPYCLCLAPGWY